MHPVGSITYRIDDPRLDAGFKATIAAVREETTERGTVSRILNCNRFNLDKAKEREAFAEKAGTDAADLLDVRARLLDLLTPVANPADETPEPVDAAVEEQAMSLLDDPMVLDRFGVDLKALGYAGDLKQPLLLYLVLMSRLLARPMNLLVGGPSSAGKSFLVTSVARFFPAAATYSLTGMSERALVYTDADLTHRTLIISEAVAIQRDGIGAAILRSIAWDVPLMVVRGFSSETYLFEASQMIGSMDKPAYLYLLTDHDPSGLASAKDVARKIAGFLPGLPCTVERVAVTEVQIADWNLPTRPTKMSDSRSRGFTGASVELDAIPPARLRSLVRGCIERHIDPAELQRTKDTEALEKETMVSIAGAGWVPGIRYAAPEDAP
jgi:hypothetical protein